jgi:tripartite-type tricarboxylate transporter receptor subunit TctC
MLVSCIWLFGCVERGSLGRWSAGANYKKRKLGCAKRIFAALWEGWLHAFGAKPASKIWFAGSTRLRTIETRTNLETTLRSRTHRIILTAASWLAVIAAAFADTYPSRPITITVPFAPGGSADANARPLAKFLAEALKQPVIIQNRSGVAGGLGAASVASAKPDGYSLLLTLSSVSAIPESQRVQGKNPDFELSNLQPVGLISAEPLILLARADARWKDGKELAAEARLAPMRISYGSSGNYGPTHLPMEMFAREADVRFLHVPYAGAAPAMVALIGGQVDLSVAAMATALPQLRAGKVKALGSWSARRMPSLPDIPTFKELGYDIEFTNWAALFAPAATPDAVVSVLRGAMQKVANDPAFLASMEKAGIPVTYMDAPRFKSYWAADMARITRTVRLIGPAN